MRIMVPADLSPHVIDCAHWMLPLSLPKVALLVALVTVLVVMMIATVLVSSRHEAQLIHL